MSLLIASFGAPLVVADSVPQASSSRTAADFRGWEWLNPFRLQQEPIESLPNQPSEGIVVASVSDMPQQPSTVRPATADSSIASKVELLEWPASPAKMPPELNRQTTRRKRPSWMNWTQSKETSDQNAAQEQKPQGLNPFAWANYSEPHDQQALAKATVAEPLPVAAKKEGQGLSPFSWTNTPDPPSEPYKGESGLSKLKTASTVLPTQEELASPISWSNQSGEATPKQLQPPEQTSFSASVQEALKWEDWTSEAEKEKLKTSRPPADATVEELVEWEKENYPWIRPFYWSEDLAAPAPTRQDFRESTLSSPGRSRATALVKPFLWTNDEPAMALQPRGGGDARTIAFLQENEELPRPPEQLKVPGQEGTELDLLREQDNAQTESGEGALGATGEDDKGTIAGAETLGREPVDNSLQFLRADTVLLDPGQVQYDYGMTYSLFDQKLLTLIPNAQTPTIGFARFRRREMLIPLEVRYGLTRRTQLFLNAPFGWSNNEFTAGTFEEFENDGGLGDIVFGGTFLLRQGDHETSDAILTFATTAPTGQDPFAIAGFAPSAPALGGGTWSLASTVLFVRNYDPIVFFYGCGTRQHFLRKVNGLNYRPGGEYNYQMGVGFAVNERVTFSTRFNGAYISETRLDSERIPGTIQEPMAISLAMTVAKEKRLIEPFVDFGITDDTTNVRLGVTWTR